MAREALVIQFPRERNAAESVSMPRLLSEREVAEIYGLKVKTLQRWRLEGRGPRWLKSGRGRAMVRYDRADIDRWIESSKVI